ncbi:MAG: terminase family protein [Bacteroidales bacterium]|nr:terminase family protein [Candidatus Scybalousia scybalohippi]
MSSTVYRLSAPQAKIVSSTKRFRLVNAGRRFGKTWVSGAVMFKKAMEGNGKIIYYIAPTLDMARDLMWKSWLKKYIPDEYIEKKNEQYLELTFKNGSVITCLSADNPDRLAGKTADLMVVDECALIKNGKYFYDLVQPLLADKYHDGEALYISTPRGYNWFYDVYCDGKSDPIQWDCFEFTTIDGGNVTQEEIDKQKRRMSPKMFAQEYMASFESVADRVYENYDRTLNNCEKDDYWGETDIHIGMDFNINPMTAVIAVMERGSLYIFDEIYETHVSNTQSVCDIIKSRYPRAKGYYVYPDPTGHRGQTNAPVGQTDFSILAKNGFIVCAPPRPYATKDKVNTVNTALCDATGHRHVFIDGSTCLHLKQSWEGYAYRENGDMDKSSGLDHISDAAAYLICYRLPYFTQRAITRPKVYGI